MAYWTRQNHFKLPDKFRPTKLTSRTRTELYFSAQHFAQKHENQD